MAAKHNRGETTSSKFGEFLSPSELQDLLGVGKSTVYALLQTQLPTHKIGRIRRVRREDLETWLSSNRCHPVQPSTHHGKDDQ
jgi:excisionase family DNA binding protein